MLALSIDHQSSNPSHLAVTDMYHPHPDILYYPEALLLTSNSQIGWAHPTSSLLLLAQGKKSVYSVDHALDWTVKRSVLLFLRILLNPLLGFKSFADEPIPG